AYVWAEQQPGGGIQYYFAVENPQGLSAMALAAILDQTVSGAPPEEIANVSPEIVFELFGSELSMGRGQGLTGMVAMVRTCARASGNPGPLKGVVDEIWGARHRRCWADSLREACCARS